MAAASLAPDLLALEANLTSARAELSLARELLAEARVGMRELEARRNDLWMTKKARLDSLHATDRANLACGLSKTALALVSRARLQKQIDSATENIRLLIASSGPICDAFELAWDIYQSAREAERLALEAIGSFESNKSDEKVAQRHSEVKRELHELAAVRQRDEDLRRREIQIRKDFALNSDGHFDPKYDDREIFLRRNRPWV